MDVRNRLPRKGQTVPAPPHVYERLLTNAEGIDETAVTVDALGLQIVEKTAALADELEQPAARVMVLGVHLEMLGQVRDPLRQERDLDLGRAGIALVLCELLDRVGLPAGGKTHRILQSLFLAAFFRGEGCLTDQALSTRS